MAKPIEFSQPGNFFAEIEMRRCRTLASALQFHAIGCYAAESRLKTLNRKAESRLEQAETAGHPPHRAGRRTVSARRIRRALADPPVQPVPRHARRHEPGKRLRRLRARTPRASSPGPKILINGGPPPARRHDSAPPLDPIDATFVVANFNPDDSDEICEVEPWTDFDAVSPRLLLDEDGGPVPFQYVAPEGKTRGLQRFAFRARVPGFGYRVFRFAKRPEGIPAPGVSFGAPAPVERTTVETGGWRLTIDGATGALASLVNKSTGLSVFTGPAHLGVAVEDPTDTWSHGVDHFGVTGETTRLEAINLLERGPLRQAVEIVTRVADSRFSTTVILPEDGDLGVELRVTLDWREKHKLFRIAYPLAGSSFEYEIAAGWLARPDDGREVSGQRWVRAARPGCDVVIANDAKYSYAALDGTLYITAARSPVFAHHIPIELQPGAVYRYLDQGEQRFVLRIEAGASRSRAEAARLADALMRPLVSTPHVSRGGTAPHQGQWLEADGGTILALKQAEDGKATVLRAVDLSGKVGALTVGAASVPVTANGIVTVRLDAQGLTESDGLER